MTSDSFELSTCHLHHIHKPHVKHSYSLSGEGDPGRTQLTHPCTAGEHMEAPQSEQQTQETGRNEGKKQEKRKNVMSIWIKKNKKNNEETFKGISGKKKIYFST